MYLRCYVVCMCGGVCCICGSKVVLGLNMVGGWL